MIKTDKQLLKYIKYIPLILVLFLVVIINAIIFIQNENNLHKDLESYKNTYIQTQKETIKNQVEKAYVDILDEKKEDEEELKAVLQQKIDEAYSIASNLYTKFQDKPNEELTIIIKEALRNLRYNSGRGSYFIFDKEGNNILYSLNPSIENRSFLQHQDQEGVFIVQELLKRHEKNKIVLFQSHWPKPNDSQQEYKKITITKEFSPLNIIIGTGEYLKDFKIESQEHVLHDYIKRTRFGKNGYIFIIDYEGNYLSHPKTDYLGKNAIELTDDNGVKITQSLINTAKAGSGFVSYIGTYMPQTGKPAKKTTYVKGFYDWSWAIGSGFYEEEMLQYLEAKEQELKVLQTQYLTKTILISIIITLFLILITQQISKYLEKSFKDYNNRIFDEVEENRKKDTILYQQAKMASMGEMIGNIAHQWRQPLSLISTATSRIQIEKELGTLDDDKHNESLEAILNSTQYLSHTIDDFRNFFNPNKVITEFTLNQALNKIQKLTSSKFENQNIEIISKIDDFSLLSCENEFIQALINIFNNAIDALCEKEQKERYIFIETHQTNTYKNMPTKVSNFVQIDIRDNAGGIPSNIMDKVFEVYFTTKHNSIGTGLGLYMTYEIITKHLKGFIEVKNVDYVYNNKPYTGAQFSIYIPLEENDSVSKETV